MNAIALECVSFIWLVHEILFVSQKNYHEDRIHLIIGHFVLRNVLKTKVSVEEDGLTRKDLDNHDKIISKYLNLFWIEE